MADSSSSGAPKKRFTIPSISDIDKFENDKPKIPSNFRSKNATSNVGSSSRTSTLATHGPSTSSSRHETVSRQKDGKDGSNRTSKTSNREQDQHQQGSTSGEGQAILSSEKAEAIKNNLELKRQRADEALRERLEAGSNPRTAAPSTSSSLQRQRTEDSSRHRLPEVANSTSASSSTGGSATSNPYRLPSFTSASEFAKRGKIGSSFASKFHMLGTAEEYKMPQAAIKQPASETTGAGTSTGSTKVPSGNSVIVNPRQRGNPILKHIRNVPWEFGDVVPDYVMGRTTCAFYLSLRYHNLNPNYISDRLTELGHKFDLRVLLVQVDVKDPHHSVKELARLAILTDCTLILAWNAEEAGRYLETYKAYENKPVDALKEKIEQNHLSKMTDCLTTVKSVNKTDVITLLANCGTFEKIVESSKEELALLPGFGPQKAQRLSNIFTEPFLRRNKRRKIQTEEGEKEDGED